MTHLLPPVPPSRDDASPLGLTLYAAWEKAQRRGDSQAADILLHSMHDEWPTAYSFLHLFSAYGCQCDECTQTWVDFSEGHG